MAATITTKLTDNSKEWVANLKKQFTEAGGSAEDFEKQMEGVNQELDSRSAQKQSEEIKRLASEFEKLQDKTSDADNELQAA